MRVLMVAVMLSVSGCMLTAEKPKPAAPAVDHSKKLVNGCYTVDLFDPYRIKYPKANVPRQMSRFLGVWKNAGWGGKWCHDLYVVNVSADGTVTLLDAHGPDKKRGLEATVFKRLAKIKNGELTFKSVGAGVVRYRLSDDGSYMLGMRKDYHGDHEITMNKVDGSMIPPLPPRKAVRTAGGKVIAPAATTARLSGPVIRRSDVPLPPKKPRRKT